MTSSTTTDQSSPARTPTAATAARWAARVLLAVAGAVGVGATIWFSFYAPVSEGGVDGGADWLVALWSMVVSLGYLYCAVALGDRTTRTLRLAQGLVLAHVAFGLVKLIGYGEEESVVFFAQDAVLLALLAVAGRGRRSG